MGKVLHVLLNLKGLDRYPSVYNALYCWAEIGWSNYVISSGATDELSDLIEQEFRFSGGYMNRATQLARLTGYFDVVIVYDPQDVEAFYATRWLLPRNTYGVLVHHCLEIPTENSFGKSLLTKSLHKMLAGGYQILDHVIIQDQKRAELFFDTFQRLRGVPFHLVSNSFINAMEPMAASLSWFDELRAHSKFLILYSGTIARWALSRKLLDRLVEIPDVTFLLSGWPEDQYAEQLVTLYGKAPNVHFHIGAKSRPALNYMVANSDAGLVWYESSDPNVAQVGLSSGKMHKFLSFHKPVITNYTASLHDFIVPNGFGLSVTANDLSEAIQRLNQDYSTFCENIRKNYSTLCNYEEEYMTFVRGLLNQHGISLLGRKRQEHANAM
jgi:glycosyltransferase involved in cell wall biosynthesis